MASAQRYFIPACLTAALFGGFLFLRDVPVKHNRSAPDDRPDEGEIVYLPHGRVLYVVVEEKGVFVGDDLVPFEVFEKFLREDGRKLKPDYAVVLGTDLARYGRVVEVFAAIRSILKVPETMHTRPVPIGTRHRAIEAHEHYWEYGRDEEEEANQPPAPPAGDHP